MDKILKLLSGKKTYIVAFLGSLLALLQAFGVIAPLEQVPSWAWRLLEFIGLGFLRAGVTKETDKDLKHK